MAEKHVWEGIAKADSRLDIMDIYDTANQEFVGFIFWLEKISGKRIRLTVEVLD